MWSREAQLSKGAFQINFWRKKSEDWGCDKISTFFSTKKFTKHKTIFQCFLPQYKVIVKRVCKCFFFCWENHKSLASSPEVQQRLGVDPLYILQNYFQTYIFCYKVYIELYFCKSLIISNVQQRQLSCWPSRPLSKVGRHFGTSRFAHQQQNTCTKIWW